jgi:hypothetical protein
MKIDSHPSSAAFDVINQTLQANEADRKDALGKARPDQECRLTIRLVASRGRTLTNLALVLEVKVPSLHMLIYLPQ